MANKQDIIEDIQVEVTHSAGCQLKATVTLGSFAASKAQKEAISAVQKKASLPGFRKGKAPQNLVISHFSPQIEKEFRSRSLSLALLRILDKEKVSPLNKDHVNGKIEKLTLEEVVCSISFETNPNIPAIDAENIPVTPFAFTDITSEDADKEIERIRKEQGEWKEIETRAITEGDHVVLDIVALGDADNGDADNGDADNGDEKKENAETQEPRPVCEDHRFALEKGSMGQWMFNLLLGKTPGETVEGISERDDSLPKDAPFIPTLYRLTIKNIVESTPLSDEEILEFFKKDSLEEVKEYVKQGMQKVEENEAKEKTKEEIASWLIENYNFDIPFSMIESLRQTAIKHKIRVLQSQGLDSKTIKDQSQAIESSVAKTTRDRLSLFLIADKFFRENDLNALNIDKEDLRKAYFQELLLPAGENSIIDKEMSPDESRSQLILQIYSERLLDYLVIKLS